jgi:Uma2 family endonuclease
MKMLREMLEAFFAGQPLVYVSGNLLVFYERGNKRRHVSPDVFVVKGVAKGQRGNYLVWIEGKGLDLVIELTSKTTKTEDLVKKFRLYRDVLKVKEYFLFDPREEYLTPSLQGYRLRDGQYHPIRAVHGRLPSRVLGLHLERNGYELRLYNPATDSWLLTPEEEKQQAVLARRQEAVARRRAEKTAAQAEEARRQAQATAAQAEEARRHAEAEAERLRRELEELRRSK